MPAPLILPDNPEFCPSCNSRFQGPFCYNCGEKRTCKKDYTISKYVTHAVDMFTHFDGKFFTSIKYLLFYPGKLTEENLAGRKVTLMKPVQLYIVINLVYFFLLKQADVFLTYLKYQINNDQKMAQLAQSRATKLGISVAEYIERFDSALPTTSKTFIFIVIPFIALGVWLFYFRKSRMVVPHLIFSTHFFTFLLAFTLIYFELILRWFNPDELSHNQRLTGILVGAFVLIVYLHVALRRVYQQGHLITLIKTISLIVWIGLIIGWYNDFSTRLNFLIV